MGAGIAKEAVNRCKGIDKKLGMYLTRYGNRAFYMGEYNGYIVLTFPTKNDWRNPTDIDLIKTSAKQIVEICDKWGIEKCYLPRPGCSNGGLSWEFVKDNISNILNDRFIVVTQEMFD